MNAVMRLSGLLFVMSCIAGCASAKSDSQPTQVREVVSGAARVRGGGVRMDVTVGQAFRQPTTKGNGVTARPASVVTP